MNQKQQAFHIVSPVRRTIRCRNCDLSYVPAEASICDCVTDHRTLRCPGCSKCSCSSQPSEIREHFRNVTAEEISHVRNERARESRLEPVPENLPRPLVVVADDNFDIRMIVKKQLESLGYGVVVVENGEEAWNAVQKFRPEIALLDGLMPKGDGRDIAKRIKDDPTLKTKTVIMTSLYTSPAHKAEAFREFRVDAYLAKPVKPEVLEKTMTDLLAATISADPEKIADCPED